MKSFLLALFLVLASFGVQAGEPTNLQQRILDYYRKVPQERVFVHTDKPCYTPGDTVWFRAHVVDAVTHMPVARSRYVYVELVDLVADTLTLRVKVKCDSDGVFAGHLALPKTLRPAGWSISGRSGFSTGK